MHNRPRVSRRFLCCARQRHCLLWMRLMVLGSRPRFKEKVKTNMSVSKSIHTNFSLICFAIAINASSTPSDVFAEVSRNGMDNCAANSYSNVRVKQRKGLKKHTFATSCSITRRSVRSDLLPNSNLCTPSLAYRSISVSQPLTFS